MSSWELITINEKMHLLKFITINSNELVCSLSDLKFIWKEVSQISGILTRAKIENPLIEYTEQTIIEAVTKPTKHYQFSVTEIDKVIIFKMKCYVSDLPFQFYWNLEKCEQDVFLEEVTKIMLITLTDSEIQRKDLIEIIQKKDVEIQQYQIEGAVLVRKHVSTEPFVETNFTTRFNRKHTQSTFLNIIKNSKQLSELQAFCGAEDIHNASCSYIECDTSNPTSALTAVKSLISPKRNKKSAKELAALRKFHSKIEQKFAYDDQDSSSEEMTSQMKAVKHTNLPQTDALIKRPKVKNKLNL